MLFIWWDLNEIDNCLYFWYLLYKWVFIIGEVFSNKLKDYLLKYGLFIINWYGSLFYYYFKLKRIK